MRHVLRCVLGSAAIASAVLVTACQSTSNSAPSSGPTSTTVSQSAPMSTPTTTVVSQPGLSAAQIYVVGRDGPRAIAPSTIFLSGDSTLYVENASWTSWTTTEATGSGAMIVNDCDPDCANGHHFRYPVSIQLDKPVKTSCDQIWSMNAFIFTGPVPSLALTPPVMQHNGHAEMDLTIDPATLVHNC